MLVFHEIWFLYQAESVRLAHIQVDIGIPGFITTGGLTK